MGCLDIDRYRPVDPSRSLGFFKAIVNSSTGFGLLFIVRRGQLACVGDLPFELSQRPQLATHK